MTKFKMNEIREALILLTTEYRQQPEQHFYLNIVHFQKVLSTFITDVKVEGDYFGLIILSEIILAYQAKNFFDFWYEVEKMVRRTSENTTRYLYFLNQFLIKLIQNN